MLISYKNIYKNYKETEAVIDFSLDIHEGEIVVLVGSSGSGKTTVLKMMNRLIDPTSGDIFFKGENTKDLQVERLRQQIGYVAQSGGLFPHKTVQQNIETTPKLLAWSKDKREARTKFLLDSVGMDYNVYAKRRPLTLSGGQKQRVAIARAMAANPPVLLMDEPFSALDPIIRHKLQDELLKLHQKTPTTILFVTHDIDEAFRLGDKIAYMEHGRLIQTGTPLEILEQPASKNIQTLLSFLSVESVNKVKGRP